MMHVLGCLWLSSMSLVSNQGCYHFEQVEEEHDEMKAELDEGFLSQVSIHFPYQQQSVLRGSKMCRVLQYLLVNIELSKYLRRV